MSKLTIFLSCFSAITAFYNRCVSMPMFSFVIQVLFSVAIFYFQYHYTMSFWPYIQDPQFILFNFQLHIRLKKIKHQSDCVCLYLCISVCLCLCSFGCNVHRLVVRSVQMTGIKRDCSGSAVIVVTTFGEVLLPPFILFKMKYVTMCH